MSLLRRKPRTQDYVTTGDLDLCISQFEKEYGMSSELFLNRWRSGELSDEDFDLNRWAMMLGTRAAAFKQR